MWRIQITLDIAILKNVGILGVKEQKHYSIRFMKASKENMDIPYFLIWEQVSYMKQVRYVESLLT